MKTAAFSMPFLRPGSVASLQWRWRVHTWFARPSGLATPTHVYFSHSHRVDDTGPVFALEDHLKRVFDNLEVRHPLRPGWLRIAVTSHCDKFVTKGSGWQTDAEDEALREATHILILLSNDYLASDYCRTRIELAREREQAGIAKVIPVLLRPVACLPSFATRVLPRNGSPVSEWASREDAIADITEGLLETIPTEVQKEWIWRRSRPCRS